MCVAGGGAGWQAGPDACHSLSLLQGQLLAPARLGQRTLYTPHTGHQDTPGTDSLHSALESCMKMETCGYQASSPSCSFTARQLMLRPNTILVTPTLLIRHKNGPPDMAGNQGSGGSLQFRQGSSAWILRCWWSQVSGDQTAVSGVTCRGQMGKHRRLVTTLCLRTPESRLRGKIDSYSNR